MLQVDGMLTLGAFIPPMLQVRSLYLPDGLARIPVYREDDYAVFCRSRHSLDLSFSGIADGADRSCRFD